MNPSDRTAEQNAIEWGVSGRALQGETESGDCEVTVPHATGALIAVIDGLGHGPAAAVASRAAAEVLAASPDRPVADLVAACHRSLQKTRGAALSVASFDVASRSVTWLGVGNVEGVLFRREPLAGSDRETLLLRGGVVGYRMPTLRAATLAISPGDTLIMATDGIAGAFSHERPLESSCQEIAADILERHGKQTDDALAVVARYVGAEL